MFIRGRSSRIFCFACLRFGIGEYDVSPVYHESHLMTGAPSEIAELARRVSSLSSVAPA